MTGVYADRTRLLTLPPGAFRPPPKVHSAVVRLDSGLLLASHGARRASSEIVRTHLPAAPEDGVERAPSAGRARAAAARAPGRPGSIPGADPKPSPSSSCSIRRHLWTVSGPGRLGTHHSGGRAGADGTGGADGAAETRFPILQPEPELPPAIVSPVSFPLRRAQRPERVDAPAPGRCGACARPGWFTPEPVDLDLCSTAEPSGPSGRVRRARRVEPGDAGSQPVAAPCPEPSVRWVERSVRAPLARCPSPAA